MGGFEDDDDDFGLLFGDVGAEGEGEDAAEAGEGVLEEEETLRTRLLLLLLLLFRGRVCCCMSCPSLSHALASMDRGSDLGEGWKRKRNKILQLMCHAKVSHQNIFLTNAVPGTTITSCSSAGGLRYLEEAISLSESTTILLTC